MIAVRETSPGEFEEIPSGMSFTDAGGVLHSWQVCEQWSDNDLAAINVYRVERVPIPDGRTIIALRYERDGGGIVRQIVTLEDVSLYTYAADARWRKEVSGITVAGAPITTDDRSKQMIIGARLAASVNPAWSTMWVGADGNIYPVDAATIIAISDAVQDHVNDCFTIFASVKADIDNGSITTTAQIDSAFDI